MGPPRWSLIVGGLIIVLPMVRPLAAQSRSTLQAGVSALAFPADSARAFGPFATWTMSRRAARYYLSGVASGVFSRAGPTGSAELAAGRRASLPGGWLGEASAELGAIAGVESRVATSMVGAARLLRPIGSGGGWFRLSGDLASREAGRLGGEGIDVGAWWRWPRIQLTTSLAQQWNMAQLFLGPSRSFVIGTVPVRYTEAALAVRVEGDDVSFDLATALRRDRDAPRLYSPAVSATAALWRSPTRAVVVTVARQLPDFIHGGDAVDYVSVGVSFNEPTPRADREESGRPIVQVSESGSRREVRVYAAGARTVEIQGDFTGWETLRLTPRNGAFIATVDLTPGSHRLVVRVDGGTWKPAANTPGVDDDFGGRVGLLLVP